MKKTVHVTMKTLNGTIVLRPYTPLLTTISISDYNFVRSGNDCVPVGPERIPAGVCTGAPDQMYQGSSGWRKIPGNTCVGGLTKDAKVDKKCSQGTPSFMFTVTAL
jgi:Sortilin, neurotensin receptor 3, C-terminal